MKKKEIIRYSMQKMKYFPSDKDPRINIHKTANSRIKKLIKITKVKFIIGLLIICNIFNFIIDIIIHI